VNLNLIQQRCNQIVISAEIFLKALAVSGKLLVSRSPKEAAVFVAEKGVDTDEHDADESEDEAGSNAVEDEKAM